VLSNRPQLLFNYFHQNFAQVTNPPLDAIREELVTSLVSIIGPRPNLFGRDAGSHKRLEVTQPVLTNTDLEKIRAIEELLDGAFRTITIDCTWPASEGAEGLEKAIMRVCSEATDAVLADNNILILSDRAVSSDRIPIPALLSTAAVHHHLIRQGLRMQTGLVVETGEAREVHHFCVLAGYGAEAINPYLAFETLESVRVQTKLPLKPYEMQKNYIKAVGKGILKVMSKMGISTYQSYCGAQIFDAVGLVVGVHREIFHRHRDHDRRRGPARDRRRVREAPQGRLRQQPDLSAYAGCRRRLCVSRAGRGSRLDPDAVAKLQHAVRGNVSSEYRAFASQINEQNERLLTIRGLMDLKTADKPVPIEEVESAVSIVKRFATGAMSFGSISREAHTTLAIADEPHRRTFEHGRGRRGIRPLQAAAERRLDALEIKQVASGRFGVTIEYLVNADDLQIKIAQGAKPGEGGQLPGHKVSKDIAKVRHSTPGVGLISPPPHHDIYSIEDLAQLIHDLKNANPRARISVKLVSEVGVGTVAAGVSKARSDHVTIAGFEGGTGASPLTSLTHAGSPWEIGLAETQQTLVLNGLRGRIAVQVDGGLRTGRDVAIGALLGADEFGFSTAPLIAVGCIMMRKCHLNTCPVGVATQDPSLRAKFTGQPEHVINYFFFVAEELREIMAKMGFRTINEMIGRVDRIDMRRALAHWKAKGVDLSKVLHQMQPKPGVAIYNCETQDHHLDKALDHELIAQSKPALEQAKPVRIELPIRNVHRTVGAMLSGEIAKRYGHAGLPEDTILCRLHGCSGRSFGAFLARGVSLDLIGDANDYVGKGLSGGRVVVRAPRNENTRSDREHHRRQHRSVRRNRGRSVFRGRGRRALRGTQFRCDRGCRRHRRSRVRIHGRAASWRAGRDGTQFRRRHVGRHRLCVRPEGQIPRTVQSAMVKLEAHRPASGPADDPQRPRQRSILVDDSGMGDMLRFDAERLLILVERHLLYTGSARARYILENWDEALKHFVKVMPTITAARCSTCRAERRVAAE
jgi:glutamate synthase (NADPH/NADH) large chain